MASYNVTITNGQGVQSLKAGTYNVTADITGYDPSTLTPSTYTATESAGSQAFTIAATGTLTINVNETGASGGTPITSGTLVMTNQDGTVDYGSPVTIGATGDAVFNNVPYGTTQEPFTLYFRQTATDDQHNIFTGVKTVSMTSQTLTDYIQNTPIAEQTFSVTDANYTGLPINGSLSFDDN